MKRPIYNKSESLNFILLQWRACQSFYIGSCHSEQKRHVGGSGDKVGRAEAGGRRHTGRLAQKGAARADKQMSEDSGSWVGDQKQEKDVGYNRQDSMTA